MYSTFSGCELQIDLLQVIILFINLSVVSPLFSLLQGVNKILLYSTVVIKGHTCMSVTVEIS